MTRSARGTTESPGKNVRKKARLNKGILQQGWGQFKNFLQYKLAWRGGEYQEVPPQNTSRRCAKCGHTEKKNRKGEKFKCLSCGHEDNADHNAAINILARGQEHQNTGKVKKAVDTNTTM